MPKILKRILDNESSAGIFLLLSAVLAMLFKNFQPLEGFYEGLLHLKFTLGVDKFVLNEPLHFWVNDALMAIFFFMIGLELKREMLEGHLKEFSQVLLPSFAAIGGVIFPAIIFAIINCTNPFALKGWAIPTATDIAFAVGVIALLGKRVPISLKIFILTLAIMDDLCAILIIALFYSTKLHLHFLLAGLFCTLLMIILNKFNVKKKTPYVICAIALWVCVLNSGIHATIAGVIAGFCVPLYIDKEKSVSILKEFEHMLIYPVNFIILPLFAFVNAGVNLHGLSISNIFEPVPLGIILGLFFGKQIGVFLFSWLLIKKFKMASLPKDSTWAQLYAIAIICGIGFTMALFVDNLAYNNSDAFEHTDKLAILIGSLISGFVGYIVAFVVGYKDNNKQESIKEAFDTDYKDY